MTQNIKLIRLITGEDIISEVVETNKEEKITYILIYPLKIIYSLGGNNGYINISLMEWIYPKIYSTTEVEIKDRDVLFITEPTEKFINSYNNVVSNLQNQNVLSAENSEDDMEDMEDMENVIEDFKKKLQTPNINKRKLH